MAQSDDAHRTSLHYRSHLPMGIRLITALLVVSALSPLYWWGVQAGIPSYVALPVVTVVTVLISNILLTQKVVLTGDGGLTITSLGRRTVVDVRRIYEIRVSAAARGGFGFARVRWDGGGLRMWQAMTYLPDPRRRHRNPASGSVSEDFRDLVHRLYLINPAITVRGIRPPAWALSPALHNPPTPPYAAPPTT
ncbi:hypothetical protein [Actinomadura sp. B10D3]|uniref:hypothetical protein n=1 Tax=Actinomadura sp. B10D3 TaxID=3153557 RepID=UPI00325EEE40